VVWPYWLYRYWITSSPVGKIRVNVGRSRAPRRKAFEHQAGRERINRRDVEQISHQRVGGAPAPLAEDALQTGKTHQIPYDQKIFRKLLFGDEGQFAVERCTIFARRVLRDAFVFQPFVA
jgi:hypothetical protein